MEVNVMGSYNLMSYAAQAMIDMPALDNGERGVILTTASVAYEDGQAGQAAYAASQGAIASLSLPAAREFAPHGIRVMTIAPGLFDTAPVAGKNDSHEGDCAQTVLQLGQPDKFAQLVVDVVGNPYLNGTVIRLDGGVRLGV